MKELNNNDKKLNKKLLIKAIITIILCIIMCISFKNNIQPDIFKHVLRVTSTAGLLFMIASFHIDD